MSTRLPSTPSDPAPVPAGAGVVEPAGVEPPGEPEPATPTGRAGRNLPAAIGVGVGLAGIVLVALFLVPAAFPLLVAAVMVLAMLELTEALSRCGTRLDPWPLLVGVIGIVVSTVVLGAEGLLLATAAAVCVVILWRATESMGLTALRDVASSVFALAWVPFLGSFMLLLSDRPDGALHVLLAIVVPVGNDVGGYVAGVLFGKHPMAPSISPKKTWEGFTGSLLLGTAAAVAVGTLALGLDWWIGVLLGVVLVIVSSCGDLAESLIKRDLGIKDMGNLLPAHGGVLDRVDSILLSAPTTFILLEVLLP